MAYMRNLKKGGGINDLIYKAEVESQIYKINLWLPGDAVGEG